MKKEIQKKIIKIWEELDTVILGGPRLKPVVHEYDNVFRDEFAGGRLIYHEIVEKYKILNLIEDIKNELTNIITTYIKEVNNFVANPKGVDQIKEFVGNCIDAIFYPEKNNLGQSRALSAIVVPAKTITFKEEKEILRYGDIYARRYFLYKGFAMYVTGAPFLMTIDEV